MKGYNTSTDYTKLWNLISDGYRVPAWIVYMREEDYVMRDLVEVKRHEGERYMIGTRGIGYEAFEDTIESFTMICKKYELQWIVPSEPTPVHYPHDRNKYREE